MSYKTSLICLKCSLLGLFLLLLQPVLGQTDWTSLDTELKARQKALGTNIVMLIWKGDTVAYKKELGEFNSKTQAPIGDASTWLTAALVMVLVDEGKVSLDDKISSYLPEFAKYGKNYITLRLCLSHMTGIADSKKIFERKKFSSLEDEVNSFAAREIRANPGQDFWYGGIGPSIAGRVLEVVTKKKFESLIKQKLFNPMTMRRTSFNTIDASAVNPASGAMSTGDDYIQFLGMLLNKGKYKGKQILSEESVNELLKIQVKPELVKFAPKAAQEFKYALGSWAIEENNGRATVLSSAGFAGTWPVLDLCHGYAYLVMTKSLLDDEKAGEQLQLKKALDEHFQAACP